MERDRHPKKDLEAVLEECEAHGWRAFRRQGYYRILCPCGDHQRSVAMTPSGRSYETNLRHWLQRCNCWEETP